MTENAYRRAPEQIDMAAEERGIRLGTTLALAITLAAFLVGHRLAPAIAELPEAIADRLAFAALCSAVPGFVLLVAVMAVSTTRRFSREDIGGQAAGPPSDRLAIRAAFLQNTLEQTVLAIGFYFALAAVASGAWLALLPVSAALFVIGRVLFYLRYHRGAGGRAPGMALTVTPSLLGYPLVAGLAVFG